MYKPLVTLFSVIIDYDDDDYFKVGVGNSLFKKKIILPAYNPYVMMWSMIDLLNFTSPELNTKNNITLLPIQSKLLRSYIAIDAKAGVNTHTQPNRTTTLKKTQNNYTLLQSWLLLFV